MQSTSSETTTDLETAVEYISASQLKEFNKCPLHWYLDYMTDYEATNDSGNHLDIGICVHEAIESALDGRDAIDDVPEIEDQMDVTFYGLADDRGLPQSDTKDAHKLVNTAKKFMRKHSGEEIQSVEEHVKYKINRNDVSSKVTGKMDLVMNNSIWDWKTGKVHPKDDKIQGIVYYVAYASKYGEFPDEVNFVFLKKGEIRTYTFEEQEWENTVINIMKRMQSAFERGRFQADFDNGLCHWCGHRYHCPEHPTGYGSISYNDWPPF